MSYESDADNCVPKSLDDGHLATELAGGEAAQQYLGKLAKLRVAQEAIATQHLQQVAHDDVEDVRRLKAKHLGEHWRGKPASEGERMPGNIIVCDDYHVNTESVRKPAPAVPVAAPVVAGLPGWVKALLVGSAVVAAGASGFGLSQLLSKPTTGKTIESHEGFLLELVPAPK